MSAGASRARSLLAGLLGLLGAGGFVLAVGGNANAPVALPLGGLLVAAVAAQLPRFSAQLLARSAWWSNAMLGLLLVLFGSRHELRGGLPMLLGPGLALLVADRRSLSAATQDAGFRPAAWLGTLQLLMVLALADAQTLTLFALLEGNRGHQAMAFLEGLAAAGLVVGFFGLLRLSLWGALCNALTSALFALSLLLGDFPSLHEVKPPLVALSTLQVLVAAPMLLSSLFRWAPPSPSPRARDLVGKGLVLATLAAGLLAALLRR